jgi:hypothetical protein
MPRWYTAEFTIKVIKAPAGEKGFCYPSHMINLDVDKEGVQCGKVLHYLKTNVTVNLWRMSSTSSMFARFLLQLCTRPRYIAFKPMYLLSLANMETEASRPFVS